MYGKQKKKTNIIHSIACILLEAQLEVENYQALSINECDLGQKYQIPTSRDYAQQ